MEISLQKLTKTSKNSKRLGRGIGSGKGKTSGKGVKGQKARSGVAIKGFEGGQTPIHMRLPKRGFNNIFKSDTQVVNIAQIKNLTEKYSLESEIIDKELLKKFGLIKTEKKIVKLIGAAYEVSLGKYKVKVDQYSSSVEKYK